MCVVLESEAVELQGVRRGLMMDVALVMGCFSFLWCEIMRCDDVLRFALCLRNEGSRLCEEKVEKGDKKNAFAIPLTIMWGIHHCETNRRD